MIIWVWLSKHSPFYWDREEIDSQIPSRWQIGKVHRTTGVVGWLCIPSHKKSIDGKSNHIESGNKLFFIIDIAHLIYGCTFQDYLVFHYFLYGELSWSRMEIVTFFHVSGWSLRSTREFLSVVGFWLKLYSPPFVGHWLKSY